MIDFAHTNILSLAFDLIGWMGLFWFSARGNRPDKKQAVKRDSRSILGILVQSLGIAIAFWGPSHFSEPLFTQAGMIASGIVGGLVGIALLLFASAKRALGANWTVVAAVRPDSSLVTSGPYALVRNPIYLAMLILTIATALSLGHLINLVMAVPVYLAGTELRIMAEEGLLRAHFGAKFDDYAKRVKRIIPFVW